MSDALSRRLARELAVLSNRGLARRLPSVRRIDTVRYALDGHEVIGLCSNDYLGLAADARLQVAEPVSTGAGASRLINGDWPELRDAERRLAELVRLPDAVLFPSGFQANVGVLPALLRNNDHVFSDRLAHASLIDGLRLAPTRATILPHLRAPPEGHDASGLRIWVTESVFSMDGDRTPADDMRAHLEAGHVLYLDEAHALGLFDGGAPWSTHNALRPTVLLGTLGKALGCAGAFVAASETTCEFIRTRARSFVFSTGVSPLLASRISHAVDLVAGPAGDALRQRLWDNVSRLARLLNAETTAPSPIFPVLVGDNETAVEIARALVHRGFHVQPIRPPTVPEGTARLRITVSAAHAPAQLESFAAALREAMAAHGLEPRVRRGRVDPLAHSVPPSTGTDASS